MKLIIKIVQLISLALITVSITNCKSNTGTDKVISSEAQVDSSLFLKESVLSITKTPCTLSDGTITECYEIVTNSTPQDHQMGPWCPTSIDDDASKGGIWLENGEVYDVDGDFVKNMATLYNDSKWKMYDEDGIIYRTKTIEECREAANPNVGVEYENFCVECLPSYVADLTQTYLIPISPVKLDQPYSLESRGGGPRADGHPPVDREGNGPPPERPENGARPDFNARGLAFNGVRFDAPAPTNAILGAYTLAPFDDAGGHINLNAGYHYHAATGISTQIKQEDGHATMIGYAMDGYGMYNQLDENGKEPTDLDDCRGHTDEKRGYHYHVAAAGSNSFINCFTGATAMN
ncbi:YHYH protein [Nonlabens sp. Asnod3-A02]|uniref:YHYH protein n=1 Tax=Nonlabens sp. Asnod3-A02 TaxID=3160579 RepID=UPI00386C8770